MSTVIFILLLCGKAYKTVLQRLFIYTILAIMVHDLTHVANAVYYYHPNSKAQVCKYIGFISIWSSWSVYIFYMVIIIYLLIFVYIQIKGDVCTLIVKRTKYFKVSVEFVTVLGSILLPTLVLWIPFVFTNYNYEFHNGFCWITGTNTSQLESDIYFGGFILYEGVGLVALCVILGIMIVYWTLSAIFQRAKDLFITTYNSVGGNHSYMVFLNVNLAAISNDKATFNASERVSAPSNTFMRSSTLENPPQFQIEYYTK